MFEVLGIGLVAFIYYYVKSLQFSNRNLPPGPFVWPFGLGVGPTALWQRRIIPTWSNLTSMRPWEHFHLWSRDYGELFSCQIGNFYAIVATSHDVITELSKVDEYIPKFSHELFTYPRTFGKELGILFTSNAENWAEIRKFTKRGLREFGFGKSLTMQSAVEMEVQELIKYLKEVAGSSGGIVKIKHNFIMYTVNVLWCMVAGKRYDHSDPALLHLTEVNMAMLQSIKFLDPVQAFAPWLNKWVPWLVKEDVRRRGIDQFHNFTKRLVEECKVDDCKFSEPSSFIGVFLRKIVVNNGNPSSIYSEQQLQSVLMDLLQTGSSSSNSALCFSILYLILHPHSQQICRQEIDRIVPRHLLPTPEDIEKMLYFQATLLEIQRLANVVPNPIPRVLQKDWSFRGYKLPKGTFIISNHYSVHMDKEYWVDPDTFRPERFINENGEFVKDKRVVHFGYGKRICIAMEFANHVISVFLASLLQNFEFTTVPGREPSITDTESGLLLSPREFSVLVTAREKIIACTKR